MSRGLLGAFLFQIRVNDLIASISHATADDIGDIARGYDNLRCFEAAAAIQAHLRAQNLHGSIISITFPAVPGFVLSRSQGDRLISLNGKHVGILYGGNVYCNVHPYGLPKQMWIDDFDAVGIKIVTEIGF
jgi:hypothetical protein